MKAKWIITGILLLILKSRMFGLERLEPERGCYFGFTLGSGEPAAQLATRLSFTPAVYVQFFDFSSTSGTFEEMGSFLDQVVALQGIAMLTLEPWSGLERVTWTEANRLAELCREAEERGIGGIFIRFSHEMNGNWYPWGQRPALFKATFRLVATTVHARTSRTALVWAPNYGVGYPFGQPVPKPGSADFLLLDTNGDGQISDRDDMYEPYYPGNDVVDWVGMTIYHWGIQFPWGENEVPLANSLANSLTGRHQGSVPNFYARYCLDPARRKPLAMPETGAFYNTERDGADELGIKQGWWRQVLAAAHEFPMLKAVNWFDEYKRESVAQNNLIDWRVSRATRIRDAFVADLREAGLGTEFLTGDHTRRLAPFYIEGLDLPDILPVRGTVNVRLQIKADRVCDLVVDLLDEQFEWQGGTRIAVVPPGGSVVAAFPLERALKDQSGYRWSIFLTKPGGDYTSAFAWYRGPNPTDDPDGDGASNREEFVAGTAPRDAADVLALRLERSGAMETLTWDSRGGRIYQILESADLQSWGVSREPIHGTGGRLSVTRNVEPAAGARFFRLEVSNP